MQDERATERMMRSAYAVFSSQMICAPPRPAALGPGTIGPRVRFVRNDKKGALHEEQTIRRAALSHRRRAAQHPADHDAAEAALVGAEGIADAAQAPAPDCGHRGL